MTENEKKLLKGFLSKTLKMDEEAMSSLFNEDGELTTIEPALKVDSERIANNKKEQEAQMNRYLKEGSQKIEKAIKKHFGFESDNIGIELVDELIQKEVGKVADKTGDLDIEKHPEFIKQKAAFEKMLREKDKEKETVVKDLETRFEKAKLIDKIKEMAILDLDTKSPLLPKDPNVAKTWREKYLAEIANGNYMLGDNGKPIVLDKDGNPMKNEHGHIIEFNDYTDSIQKNYFEFAVAQPRNSTGFGQNNQSNGKAPVSFANQDDYVAKMREAKSPEERAELTKAYTSTIKK